MAFESEGLQSHIAFLRIAPRHQSSRRRCMSETNSCQPLAGRRLLLAEDDMAVALSMDWLLKTAGCDVVRTARCKKGLALLAANETFDVSILDITLADGAVYPLAEALAARHVPFIFLTGYGVGHLAAEWRGWPMLEKPMEPDVLIDWLARHI